jgi:DNA primase
VPERDERKEDPHAGLREAAAFAAEWFESRLASPAGSAARAYLSSRGIDDDVARQFRLGYAPDEWRAFREAATAHGLAEGPLLELGLLATSERAEEPYDRFRGRLMFTILDLRDRPIGFGARLLEERARAPKYLNSPESPIFHKREELYGLNWARHQIRREGFAALVEGFTDVISLHRAGVGVAVAGLGTSFTREQAVRIGRYAERVFLLYDSDRAGLRATFRTGDVLLAADVHPLVVTLPAGEDPDSVARSDGPGAIRALLDDAVDVLERKIQILANEGYLGTVEGRRRAVDGLLSTLRAVRDPALRDIYLDRAAEGLGVRRDTLVHEIARTDRTRIEAPREDARGRPDPGRPRAMAVVDRAEHDLSLLLARDPQLLARALRLGLTGDHFSAGPGREMFEHLERQFAAGTDVDWSRMGAEARELVTGLLDDPVDLGDPDEIFEAASRRLLFRSHRGRLREIDRELKLADSAQQRRLLVEKQTLAAEMREAGEAAAFMPNLFEERDANGQGTIPAGSRSR